MAVLPLVSMFVNCYIWTYYGCLTGSAFPVGATQGFGELAALSYNVVYFVYSSPDSRKKLRKLYAGALGFHCAITLYVVLGVAGVTQQTHFEIGTWLGYIGTAVSVVVFFSPLATLKRVVETKSAASIPINLSLMIFVSSVLWVATGLLDSDYFITGLNAAGVVLGLVQILMYCMYRPQGMKEEQSATGTIDIISPKDKSAGLPTENPNYTFMKSPIPVA